MAGIRKGDYAFEEEMMGDMGMPMEEEAPAAEAGVDLSAVSDDDLMAEAERRGLLEVEAKEPAEDEMAEDEMM